MRGQGKRAEGMRLIVVCVAALGPSVAMANVNLEWRASSPLVFVGETIDIGLYMVSDDQSEQSVSGYDAIFTWDPDVLTFEARIDNSPYAWFFQQFGNDWALDRLNADCGLDLYCDPFTFFPFDDGDAYYSVAAGAIPAMAPPEGLLAVTFVFRADAPGPKTALNLVPALGGSSSTRVLSADPLGAEVTGDLGSLTIAAVPCGTHGDFNEDCQITSVDYGSFAFCITGPSVGEMGLECEAGDMDGDGDSDLVDIALFQAAYVGP